MRVLRGGGRRQLVAAAMRQVRPTRARFVPLLASNALQTSPYFPVTTRPFGGKGDHMALPTHEVPRTPRHAAWTRTRSRPQADPGCVTGPRCSHATRRCARAHRGQQHGLGNHPTSGHRSTRAPKGDGDGSTSADHPHPRPHHERSVPPPLLPLASFFTGTVWGSTRIFPSSTRGGLRPTDRAAGPQTPDGPGPHRGRGRRGGSATRQSRNELIWIVSSRPGPTPIAEIGAPDMSSSALTYACAFFGRSANVFAFVMSSDQPGRNS
jgi:hypothetical protein